MERAQPPLQPLVRYLAVLPCATPALALALHSWHLLRRPRREKGQLTRVSAPRLRLYSLQSFYQKPASTSLKLADYPPGSPTGSAFFSSIPVAARPLTDWPSQWNAHRFSSTIKVDSKQASQGCTCFNPHCLSVGKIVLSISFSARQHPRQTDKRRQREIACFSAKRPIAPCKLGLMRELPLNGRQMFASDIVYVYLAN